MRRSLLVGDVEVEIITPDGTIEELVVESYGPFLGAVEHPVFCVHLEPRGEPSVSTPKVRLDDERAHRTALSGDTFGASIDRDGCGRADVDMSRNALDQLFHALIALAAPERGALFVRGRGAIVKGRGQVILGALGVADPSLPMLVHHVPFLGDRFLLLQRSGHEWIVASSPFWSTALRPARSRRAPLAAVHLPACDGAAVELGRAEVTRLIASHLCRSDADHDQHRRCSELVSSLAGAVPIIVAADPAELRLEEIIGVCSVA